jgi:hypothetical protein
VFNGRWREGDAIAGVAWIEYMAWARSGERKYLDAARRAMEALDDFDRSTFYEVLLPYGVTLAARMNAEHGCDYDVTQLLNWCLDGNNACRPGWGVIAGHWNGYDVSGLQGSITDGGGYAFAMNTFERPPPHPLPRYDGGMPGRSASSCSMRQRRPPVLHRRSAARKPDLHQSNADSRTSSPTRACAHRPATAGCR